MNAALVPDVSFISNVGRVGGALTSVEAVDLGRTWFPEGMRQKTNMSPSLKVKDVNMCLHTQEFQSCVIYS